MQSFELVTRKDTVALITCAFTAMLSSAADVQAATPKMGIKQQQGHLPCTAWVLQPPVRITYGRVQIIDNQGNE